jgi:hypothetical protein
MSAGEMQKRCGRCGGLFGCRQGPACWCEDIGLTLQQLADLRRTAVGCLCPSCLDGVRRTAEEAKGV